MSRFISYIYINQKPLIMKSKFKYLVLEVNSDVEKCTVKNQITGEVIQINRKSADGELLRIINKVDDYDLIAGDEFN